MDQEDMIYTSKGIKGLLTLQGNHGLRSHLLLSKWRYKSLQLSPRIYIYIYIMYIYIIYIYIVQSKTVRGRGAESP